MMTTPCRREALILHLCDLSFDTSLVREVASLSDRQPTLPRSWRGMARQGFSSTACSKTTGSGINVGIFGLLFLRLLHYSLSNVSTLSINSSLLIIPFYSGNYINALLDVFRTKQAATTVGRLFCAPHRLRILEN
jgi:hypothetical protein